MATTFDLLALPNELISIVLDQTTPSDFERLMLSCKTVYESGKPALLSHNEARKAITYTETGVAGSSQSNRLYMPLEVLTRIAKKPEIDRRRSVALVHGLQYFYRATDWQSGDSFARLVDILQHMPGLLEKFVGIIAHLREQDHSSDAKHTAPLDELRRLELVGLIKEVKETGLFWPGNRPCGEGTGASQAHWDVTAILLMEGLRRLTINETIIHLLAESLNESGGKRWLQELRDLRIQGRPSTVCWNLTAWLCLPKLRSLVVDELRPGWQCQDAERYHLTEQRHLRTIFDDHPSPAPSLEHLVILQTTLHPEEILPVVLRLPHLRTLAWCVSQDEELNSRIHFPKLSDYPEERASEYIIYSNALHLTADILADRSEEELRSRFYELDLSEVPTLDKMSHGHFPLYTRTLVDALLEREHTATNKLEHLILTIHNESKEDFILSQHCIPHFKDFTHLTHLEIDDRLLSREVVVVWENMSDIELKCLVEYLPPSIVHVRLHMSNEFSNCRHLLADVAKRRDEVPNLRVISVRDLAMVQNRQVLYQAEQDLRAVGIELVVEAVHTDPAWVEKSMCFERIDGGKGIDTTFFQL